MQTFNLTGQTTNTSLPQGGQQQPRGGKLGETVMQELHGRYYETTYNKAMFSAANQAAMTTSAALTTTYTGLSLSNPINSNVNLVLCKVGVAAILAQTSPLAVGLLAGINAGTNVTHTTALTPANNFIGQPAGQGKADSSATLTGTPVLLQLLGSFGTGATTVDQADAFTVDLEGSIVIPPGGYVALYTSAASAASSLLASFSWEEVPV